ncbi:MAG: phosphoenolpyruvate carboxylase [Polyangia bacterium]
MSSRSPADPKEAPLREDVRRLGSTVGALLAEQLGQPFYEQVERVRTLAIARRAQRADATELATEVEGLPANVAADVARAFSTYFQMVNLAERVHRIRRRHSHERTEARPQPESLLDTVFGLRRDGVSKEALLACIATLDIEPVFTAHPTEAVRDELLEKEQEIIRCLLDDLEGDRVPSERAQGWERLRTALTSGWQTSEVVPVRPSVEDEVEHACFYLAGTIYRVLPTLHELLTAAVAAVYEVDLEPPRFLRFGSWVGGDMDGNPNVGADTITATFRTQRRQVLARYVEDVDVLRHTLTQTSDRVAVSPEVLQRIDEHRAACPDVPMRARHANIPYRVLLDYVRALLLADDTPYDPGAFAADLAIIAASLRLHQGAHAGLHPLRRLQLRVDAFGFHLARLDTRQDSRIHGEALAALLGDADWTRHDDATQRARLRPHAKGTPFPHPEAADRVCGVFTALAEARRQHGDAAVGLSIISMCHRAADLLCVLALARQGGLVDADGAVALDIVPLLETVDDLRAGPDVLRALFTDEVYRAHLAARADRQIVMLGYSDSAKDGGIVASRWALQRAQIDLGIVAKQHGVTLSYFHGRGGSASRGGGRVAPALNASPRGSVDGTLRVTEQGEVIARKYGIRTLAVRELEQAVGAVLRATLKPRPRDDREAIWRGVMAQLAERGRDCYRALVSADGFVDYFRAATPIDVIEKMTLGSRPSRRGTMKGIESLRAIPWVFAWNQNRSVMTAWYGLGTALEDLAAIVGETTLAEMARDWPFFTTLLEDIDMVLAKSDLSIAERFSELAGPLHDTFFPLVAAEHARTVEWVLRLRGQTRLLEQQQRLARSIALRNPYIDPMSFLSVDLLSRWRATGSTDDALLAALVAAVSGVARGLQNTG